MITFCTNALEILEFSVLLRILYRLIVFYTEYFALNYIHYTLFYNIN